MDQNKGSQTKAKIFDAATKLFFKHGFYGVTYAQIAKAVGISNAAIYKHFTDMDDLVLKACLHWSEEAEEWIRNEISEFDSAQDQLKSYIEVNLKYALKNREKDALLLGLYHYSVRSKEMLKVYESFKTSSLSRIEIYIARGSREKLWPVTDSASHAYTLHSLMVGEVIKLVIEPKEEPLQDRIERVFQTALKILNAF